MRCQDKVRTLLLGAVEKIRSEEPLLRLFVEHFRQSLDMHSKVWVWSYLVPGKWACRRWLRSGLENMEEIVQHDIQSREAGIQQWAVGVNRFPGILAVVENCPNGQRVRPISESAARLALDDLRSEQQEDKYRVAAIRRVLSRLDRVLV